MEKNENSQDSSDKMLSISILKLNKLNVLLDLSMYKLQAKVLWYVKNIFCF